MNEEKKPTFTHYLVEVSHHYMFKVKANTADEACKIAKDMDISEGELVHIEIGATPNPFKND